MMATGVIPAGGASIIQYVCPAEAFIDKPPPPART